MNKIQIDQADIDDLAEALDALALRPGQKALLTAIVSMAAKVTHEDEVDPALSFCDQFATAFTPGKANFLVTATNITKHGP